MPAEKIAKTPNILLLFVDEMRYDAMGCAGNDIIRTPNLDRMAAKGIRFDRAYTPVPVCIAARNSLLHGHRCATHGRFANNVPDPEPLLCTMPQLLGNAGYHTQAIGKMHFRPVQKHMGFHRMQLMEEIPDFRQDDEYLMYLKANGYGHKREVHGVRNLLYYYPQTSAIPEEHHGSTWVADRTIDFLHEYTDRPFFCMASWIAPPPPWNAPEPFASMYANEEMPLPIGLDIPEENLPIRMLQSGAQLPPGTAKPEMLQRIKALYYANVSLIDKGVGRILDTLDKLALSENTLVIFTSDHGEHLGDYGGWGKSTPYDASARIPFLMRMPGVVEKGRASDELVSLLDLMPTYLDLAETEYPGSPSLPGASLLGAGAGGTGSPRNELVIEIGHENNRWLSLIRGRHKYNYYLSNGFEELFDLKQDPQELNNALLSPSPADKQMALEMKACLTQWEREHGFESSLEESGELKNFGQKWSMPVKPVTNTQFPRWVGRLPEEESVEMESISETVRNVASGEDTFTPEELPHFEKWLSIGGSLD